MMVTKLSLSPVVDITLYIALDCFLLHLLNVFINVSVMILTLVVLYCFSDCYAAVLNEWRNNSDEQQNELNI